MWAILGTMIILLVRLYIVKSKRYWIAFYF
jgi:hypothetical protein